MEFGVIDVDDNCFLVSFSAVVVVVVSSLSDVNVDKPFDEDFESVFESVRANSYVKIVEVVVEEIGATTVP